MHKRFKLLPEEKHYLASDERQLAKYFHREESGKIVYHHDIIREELEGVNTLYVTLLSDGDFNVCKVHRLAVDSKTFEELWIIDKFKSVPHLLPSYILKEDFFLVSQAVDCCYKATRDFLDDLIEFDKHIESFGTVPDELQEYELE